MIYMLQKVLMGRFLPTLDKRVIAPWFMITKDPCRQKIGVFWIMCKSQKWLKPLPLAPGPCLRQELRFPED